MSVVDLLKKAKELELIARRNAHSLLAGDYTSTIPGRGLQFHEARKYVFGESVRMIDWNMTARLGEPYVKTFLEEREREVFIALDVSPSMFTGFQDRTKIEFAIEVAATLAFSSIQSRDKVGYIIFNNEAVEVVKPSSGKTQLFRTIKAFLTHTEKKPDSNVSSDIRSVLHAIQKFKRSHFILFIISDFLDYDLPEDLKFSRIEHDINMLHIYDPVEYDLSKEVFFPSISPESNFGNKNTGIVSPGELGSLEEMNAYLKSASVKYRISVNSIKTTVDVGRALKEFFHLKKRVNF
ncbi:MAG: DUF58 domain-containing protein [Leptospiraceae bacterium]|nr:DUF58 domain-containing protein [Leptospiraceae bacterium]